jgi:ribose 5-phosphate isomerase B
MRIAIGSDEVTRLTDLVVKKLDRGGHQLTLVGPLAGERARAGGRTPWPLVAREVAEAVARGCVDMGILFCTTGTGVSIAANKVVGVRAALCGDAATAKGARLWNDANVLCLSIRATSEAVASEIVDTWLDTAYRPNSEDDACLSLLREIEQANSQTGPLQVTDNQT